MSAETIRIRFTQLTNCETIEGQRIEGRAGLEAEVPLRAGRYLIACGKALEVVDAPDAPAPSPETPPSL